MVGHIDIPDMMLAAQLIEYDKPYKIHAIPTPTKLDVHDMLLKVAVASYCHTDGMVQHGLMGTTLPCVASHEGAGTVVAVGSEVFDFKLGDRVMAGLPKGRCGHCADCLGPADYKQYCPNVSGMVGVTLDGAFAEYMQIDSREACLIPDKISFENAAPLACAGCTVWRGVLQANLTKGETIGLIGAGGGLGHLGVQFAKALGLLVVGVDTRQEGLELARLNGADVVVDGRKAKEQVVHDVQSVTNGKGVDATLTLSDADGAAAMACAITRRHGTVVQIAQPPEVKIPYHELVFRDIRLKGSLLCTRSEAQRMLDLVAVHEIKVRTNLFFGLDKLPEMIELIQTGKMAGKGMVVVAEDEQTRLQNMKVK